MAINKWSVGVLFLGIMLAGYFFLRGEPNMGIQPDKTGYVYIASDEDVCRLLPQTVKDIEARFDFFSKFLKEEIQRIIATPPAQYNKETLLYSLDKTNSVGQPLSSVCELLRYVHPQEEVRNAAAKAYTEIGRVYLDLVSTNKKLYEVYRAYYEGIAKTESLTDDERYALDELMRNFKSEGLDLSDEVRDQVYQLKKELLEKCSQFGLNISADRAKIEVEEDVLAGVSPEWIATLEKTSAGKYILETDYPTSAMVMAYCSNGQTRKAFRLAMGNKAYPANESVLYEIVSLRDKMAQLLGFKDFTTYSLFGSMAQNPDRVKKMHDDLLPKAQKKAKKEVEIWSKDLPEGVFLTSDGKINPWDFSYITTYYKKKYLGVDELKIAEYFPMEKTIEGLFKVYEKFFNVSFEKVKNFCGWHEDVSLLKVLNKNKTETLGYVFLDMFPRENKYNHAACFNPLDAHKDRKTGKIYPGVAAVVCNFTKPTKEKPSLLRYDEVNTFFHEFGHALHLIFGAVPLTGQSSFHTKIDFVELPSQMLENWLEDKEILKMISSHYQTGEPLPDDLIDRKIEEVRFATGTHETRQIALGSFALALYEGIHKDIHKLYRDIFERCSSEIAYASDTHGYCSFGHLTDYNARYYGYLWSRIFSQDVFADIEKKHGLLDSAVGERYKQEILAPAASKDPNELLRNYLGRDPNQEAFLKKMGFE